MRYQAIRPLIKSGDIIAFAHGHKPVGKVVQLVTGSPYTHVAISWVVADRVYVFEAVQPLVRIFPLSKLTPFYWCGLNGDLNENALEFLNSVVGDRYSLADCYRSVTGETTTDNRWQCAELCREGQRRNGNTVNCKATPKEIVQWATTFGVALLVE